jgi:imidazolonepropionase-like amidohydrolase
MPPMKCFAATALVVGLSLAQSALSGQSTLSPAGTIVFRNVAGFDGSRLVRRTTILVRDGIIRAVGPETVIPADAQIVEGEGRTLLPGLIDAHTHLGLMFGEQFLREALTFGVTTELEMWGAATSMALKNQSASAADAATAGRGPGHERADLRTAGTGITVPKGHPTHMGGPAFPTLGPDVDEQQLVDARIAEGSDYIKIIYDHSLPTLTMKQLAAVVTAGHRRNKLVVAHVRTQSDARDAIIAGIDGLVHIFADSPPAPDVVEMAARRGVFVVATLSVIEAVTAVTARPDSSDSSDRSDSPYNAATPWWRGTPHVMSRITPPMQRSLEAKMPAALGAGLSLANGQAVVAALHRAGVPIVAGTDAPAPGLAHGVSMHRELELLVLSGLTPLQALAAATSVTARAFGLHDRGRIATGLRADLLLVNGDPTTDIRATRDIVGIWKLGTRCACPPQAGDRPAPADGRW